MSDDSSSQQARKGLFDAAKGKAKEVVGALTSNDSLTTEGQLQTAQAHEHREAKATELAAEAQAEEAGENLAEVKNTADAQRAAAQQSARDSEDAIRQDQQAQRVAAEQKKDRTVAAEVAGAEVEARAGQIEAMADGQSDAADATADELNAMSEHRREVSDAEAARSQADQIRQEHN